MAILLCAVSLTRAIGLQHYFFHILRIEQQVINGVNFRIFDKTLRLSYSARMDRPVGDVINILGSDSNAVSESPGIAVEVIYTLFIFAAVSAMLFHYLGPAALASLAVFVLLLPFTKILAQKFVALDEELMTIRDERVSLTSQILSAIRVVKYFTWEKLLINKVEAHRLAELSNRKTLVLADSFSRILYLGARTLACLAGFSTFILLGNELDPATAFACIALFMAIEDPFGNLSTFIGTLSAAKVSARRIICYLESEDHHLTDMKSIKGDLPFGVELTDVTCRYKDETNPAISNVCLKVGSGESVAIVGPVGAGKSSLIRMILGEIPLEQGTIAFPGCPMGYRPRMGWTPQESFIRNVSLRENILFGESDEHLNEALQVTMLAEDLERIHGGLEAEIGERGINLSGGQKQRLSLARCFIRKPGLILLDDPLSAVDSNTETELIERLIFGKWRHKTRIVVTHRLKYLHRFDRVIFVENGGIVTMGNLLACLENPRFRTFFRQHANEDENIPDLRVTAPAAAKEKKKSESADIGALMTEEDRAFGAINASMYLDYLLAMIGPTGKRRIGMLLALLGSALAVCLTPLIQNIWVAHWTQNDDSWKFLNRISLSQWQNILVFGVVSFLVLISYLLQRLIWGLGAINASKKLHNEALVAVIAAPIRFFDTTPVGRILNRFSRDVDMVERNMPWAFEAMIRSGLGALTALIVLLTAVPVALPLIIPALWIYYRLQRDFRMSGREAKRLMSITTSPRFAHFKETLEGHGMIRVYEQESAFWQRFFDTLANNQRMFYAQIALNRWISVRIPILSSGLILAAIIGVVLTSAHGMMTGGVAGVVLIYALSLTGKLDWSIRAFSEAEARMTSLERLKSYSLIKPEVSVVRTDDQVDKIKWRAKGTIEFDQVVAS
jgi:ABC-type multidrug transport system fused ATPase/permease subunit